MAISHHLVLAVAVESAVVAGSTPSERDWPMALAVQSEAS